MPTFETSFVLQNNHCEFHKTHTQIQKVILYAKIGFKWQIKDNLYINTNYTQNWYGELN